MTEYERHVTREAARELYKALKILNDLDCNLGLIQSIHNSVILSCADILNTIAEDMYANSKEQ